MTIQIVETKDLKDFLADGVGITPTPLIDAAKACALLLSLAAGGQNPLPVAGHGIGSDSHDGHISQRGIVPQRLCHCIAVHDRQLDVQQDRHRLDLARQIDPLAAVPRLDNLVTILLQDEGYQVEVLLVILDD